MAGAKDAGHLTEAEHEALWLLQVLTPRLGHDLPVPTLFARKGKGRTATDMLNALDGLVAKKLAAASHDRFTYALTDAGAAVRLHRPAGWGEGQLADDGG